MAKSSGNALDDLIADEFAEMRDLSKEDDSVSDFLDTGNYSLNYICSKRCSWMGSSRATRTSRANRYRY